ncbi:hypothetical protein Pcinc_035783 [Petrolisthes cinctipes]|uniref:C2H2-type domain-containing protein n=1 Tax=Petrolisthes cinctipes TaxID=88211 RepID=A0AAE1BZ52_PETCI|nr:hypothetical protein Pcinc_035783 [Petrolisthes cinctipes]
MEYVGAVLTLPLIIIADCGALSGKAGSGGGGSGGGGEDHNSPPAATDPHTNGAGVGAGGGRRRRGTDDSRWVRKSHPCSECSLVFTTKRKYEVHFNHVHLGMAP